MAKTTDPTQAIRELAAQLACAIEGTACSQSSFKAGTKAYLYVGPGAKGVGHKAMFKLTESVEEAKTLASREPDRFEVGVGNWVTARFSAEDPLPKRIWSRWLRESYAAATGSSSTRKKSARRKKA